MVTGENTGIVADGDVEDAVVGDGNQTVNVDGDADGAGFNFGSGDQTVASGNNVYGDGIAGATGGDATNVSNNEASEGGAISGTGDASGTATAQQGQRTPPRLDAPVDVDYEGVTTAWRARRRARSRSAGHFALRPDPGAHADTAHAGTQGHAHQSGTDHGSSAGHELEEA